MINAQLRLLMKHFMNHTVTCGTDDAVHIEIWKFSKLTSNAVLSKSSQRLGVRTDRHTLTELVFSFFHITDMLIRGSANLAVC